jgi:hypothetical protein
MRGEVPGGFIPRYRCLAIRAVCVCATATRRRDAIAHTTTDERHRPPLSAGDLLLSFAFHGPRPAGWWLGWLEMLVAPVRSQLNVTALSQLGSGKCF